MSNFLGKKVLIMGYGLNQGGSGPQAAKYLAKRGALLTVTDLRSAEVLAPTMQILQNYDVRWVLGKHMQEDFDQADLIVKNPGVHKRSPYLVHAKRIETDLSLFLQERQPKIIAVTGSKGKSTVCSLIFHVLQHAKVSSFLAGNITVSPLTYLDEMTNEDHLVLELSSWQTGDLSHRGLLRPQINLITNIYADHQNYYENNMEDYAGDKAGILHDQSEEGWVILNLDDDWTPFFAQRTRGKVAYFSMHPLPSEYVYGAYLQDNQITLRWHGSDQTFTVNNPHVLPQNLLMSSLVLFLSGMEITVIQAGLKTFRGLQHRLQLVGEKHGISYYNDTSATIPIATISSVRHLAKTGKNLHLIFGGADKEIDFAPLLEILPYVSSWHIFEGSALPKIKAFMDSHNQICYGPYNSMSSIVKNARKHAHPGDIILLSPGCASFGLFLNEFDRGTQFCHLVEHM